MNWLLVDLIYTHVACSEKGNDESQNEHNLLWLYKNGFERLCATWLVG